MKSLWLSKNTLPRFPSFEGDKKTDVLIIGGGLCGILCAYELDKLGVDYILLEGERICEKTSGNTTAKITSQHGLIYKDIVKKYGVEAAEKYHRINERAISEYAHLCENIDCSFERKDNYIYSLSSPRKLDEEMEALEKISAKAKHFPSLSELPFDVAGAIRFSSQAQFDPIAFVSAIAPKLNIFENSHVMGYDGKCYYGRNFKVKAEKVIVATHFPIFNKIGFFSLKLYQHRSYVIALEGAQKAEGMYVDECDKGLSFRSYGDQLLLGGGGHRTGKQGGCWQELEEFAAKYYKDAKIKTKWATQDCMTLDGVPYVGHYSRSIPNVFVATGFNKWGMTNAMASADILCDLISGKANRYSAVFSPSRTMIRPQLAANVFESAVGLLTPTAPRCPHLGCALKYNRAEHSWDCPCHGSRFAEDGQLIDNPATDDKKI